ncbi:putative drug exporter of the RND superfamily [Microbispora rosea]|uniref:Putative drug exporter of the RND superfamily n=1 Tax=Microbispora rosea TaxID=58117 RepID=A0A1N6RXH2_9ACTN|nr:MMPL family transporter [Microbispora rosea]GIH45962.1 membrane protein [Microbispora rosea subsp. rosea]SIQ33521.1 putative drug exporter of the RND superfamily [Microbispora rosea]
MFGALGRSAVRHRRLILLGALLFTVVAGVWGAGVFGRLGGGAGFDDPGSPSAHADRLLAGPLGRHTADVVVLYESDHLTVDDPAFAGPVRRALDTVPREDVARLESHWSTGAPGFVSHDRHATYVTVQFRSSDDQERVRALRGIRDRFEVRGLTVRFGGVTAMTDQVNSTIARDIGLAEAISVPILLVLLAVVFRSLLAAALPLVVGVVAALGTMAVLRLVTLVADVSTFAIQVVTVLGLGLAIDYALLAVTRFREELGRGGSVETAVERTTATAGRTIAFSGAVVALSFAGLAVFPSRFLQSMAYAGAATVVLAVLTSLTVLPALLAAMGHRAGGKALGRRAGRNGSGRPDGRARPAASGERWYRLAHAVMRRPRASALAVVAVLVALGLPFLGVNWARPGDWVLPSGADARTVTRELAERFTADPAKVVTAVVEAPRAPSRAALDGYAARLDAVPGVEGASVTGTTGPLARITLGYAMDPMSRQAVRMVEDLRAVPPPAGAVASFTGMPASRVDIVDMVVSRLPWMALFVAVVSVALMFLAFGSVILPIKSVLLNLLSLSASFGAVKLIFQDGRLAGLLGFEPVGAVDVNFPVLIVAIAFGLAMDYEMFLLSRVREERERGADPAEAMARGLARTAGIVTSAALLVAVSVAGFAFSSVTLMKMIGVGLVIAVAVDATIVRGLLVPATMRLLGERAWWAPRPLARWWRRHGLPEHPPAAPSPREAVTRL